MGRSLTILKNCAFAALGFLWACQSALADPVWHCSRSDIQIADASDNFTLASLTLEREVIRISVRDLHAVYEGAPVRMSGGLTLSACVIANKETSLTATAMKSIGAPAITPSKLHIRAVPDEASMLACITKHHPAVGYLSQATHTEAAGPCF